MSDILAKMQAVHDDRTMTAVPVPEYDTCWYFPPLTISARARCLSGVKADDESEAWVNTLIQMAHDESGARIFPDDAKTRKVLYAMDMKVVKRVLEAADPDASDPSAVKNG